MVFEIEKQFLKPVYESSRQLLWGLVAYAAIATFGPVLLPRVATPLKLAAMVTGTASFFAAGAIAQQQEQSASIMGAIAKGQQIELRQSMSLELAQTKREQEMRAAWGTLRWIYFNYPAEMHQAIIQQYGLENFVAKMRRRDPQTVDVYAQGAPSMTMAAATATTTDAFDRPDLDTSWLTPEFARTSKVVAAGRGSGKSTYLRWELGECTQDRNMILLFIDPHLLANQREAGEKAGADGAIAYWFPDLTAEQEREAVIHTAERAKRELRKVYAETMRRMQGADSGRLLKIIVEEADSVVFTGRDGAGAELQEVLQIVTNEARKSNVELTLVTHTLKKGKTGFDASYLAQISWLMLGNILASPDIVWPSDLDTKAWQQERDMLQASLDDSVGRAAVLRNAMDGKNETSVVLIPRFADATEQPTS
ncbi:MAG: hypothetical protein HC771_13150 [Synechococcales cyanobacterium CRU_2_2]|nr:hypothetical protein [Synechococcales cyanobacterium CRU_2_2]